MKNSDVYTWPFYLFGLIFTFLGIAANFNLSVVPVTVTSNPIVFTLLGFYWFSALVAYIAALIDVKLIRERLKINHSRSFILRASLITIAAIVMSVPLLNILAAAFLFSIIFNLTLNGQRNKKWHYISRSNHYDRFWFIFSNNGIIKYIAEIVSAITLFMIIN